MGTAAVGKVAVPAKIENLADLLMVQNAGLAPQKIRSVDVPDALIGTGATMLSLPERLVRQLGLTRRRSRIARTPAGTASFGIYDAVRLTVFGRDCVIEVAEVPDDCPVLIGQVPLEILDFVVDPVNRRLIGNPDHGGEQRIDLFGSRPGRP